MGKKFSQLQAGMRPEAQSRSAALAEAMLLEMQLQQLRKSRNVTQTKLADLMSIEQGAISKLERRDDMYVSPLREHIKALGGELKLVASFPDTDIQVDPYTTLAV